MVEDIIEDPLSSGERHKAARLSREFYQRPTTDVAEGLLGKILVSRHLEGMIAVRLTEVEAYLGPTDPACHTFGGRRTARVLSMWGDAGHAYAYLIYGMYHCLNVVTVGQAGEAVLLRAGHVVSGEALIRKRRGPRVSGKNLVNGPGKLCQALAVDRSFDGLDFCSTESGLWIADDGFQVKSERISTSPRIGLGDLGEAKGWPLRFYCKE